MSTKTQVYLTDEQRRRVTEIASAEGISMSEVIRRALDEYLAEGGDPDRALAATFGVSKDLEIPSRSEWGRGV